MFLREQETTCIIYSCRPCRPWMHEWDLGKCLLMSRIVSLNVFFPMVDLRISTAAVLWPTLFHWTSWWKLVWETNGGIQRTVQECCSRHPQKRIESEFKDCKSSLLSSGISHNPTVWHRRLTLPPPIDPNNPVELYGSPGSSIFGLPLGS